MSHWWAQQMHCCIYTDLILPREEFSFCWTKNYHKNKFKTNYNYESLKENKQWRDTSDTSEKINYKNLHPLVYSFSQFESESDLYKIFIDVFQTFEFHKAQQMRWNYEKSIAHTCENIFSFGNMVNASLKRSRQKTKKMCWFENEFFKYAKIIVCDLDAKDWLLQW